METNEKDTSATDLVPTWSISTWIYGFYPGSDQDVTLGGGVFSITDWLKSVIGMISDYNNLQKFPNSKINQTYPYATDIELPWASGSTLSSGNMCKGGASCWSLSDPTQINCQYGFYFLKTNSVTSQMNPPTPPQNMPTNPLPPTFLVSTLNLDYLTPIIDGRIDNGYLMGFNDIITEEDAENLATLIVNGGYSQQLTKPSQDYNYQVGVGAFGPTSSYQNYFPKISGVQLDLEPFNVAMNNQAAFYKKVGALLAENGQYYSVFTYPKVFNQTTASVLNSSNNGLAIVALYDLVDMKYGIPDSCTNNLSKMDGECDVSGTSAPVIAAGDSSTAVYDKTVPHTLEGYYNAALLAVKQTIAQAAQTKIKYKFAIPMTASVHEFENWGVYTCSYSESAKATPNSGYCRTYNTIPLNIEAAGISQLEYVIQAVRAIRDGTKMMGDIFTNNYDLFRGIDFYSFGFRTIWTPQNPVIDYQSGYIYYGNTAEYVETSNLLNPPYVYTTPSAPLMPVVNGVLNQTSTLGWLSSVNLDFRPCNSNTCSLGTCVNDVCVSKT
jgi:hypothetical protein